MHHKNAILRLAQKSALMLLCIDKKPERTCLAASLSGLFSEISFARYTIRYTCIIVSCYLSSLGCKLTVLAVNKYSIALYDPAFKYSLGGNGLDILLDETL